MSNEIKPQTLYVPVSDYKVLLKYTDDIRYIVRQAGEPVVVSNPKAGDIFNWNTVKETAGYLLSRKELEVFAKQIWIAATERSRDEHRERASINNGYDDEPVTKPNFNDYIKSILP